MQVVVRVEVGQVGMTVEQALGLVPGRVLLLDREVGPGVSLFAGDQLVARGELVEHEGQLGVEIVEVP
jgi:flagellar motor switch protein FliM